MHYIKPNWPAPTHIKAYTTVKQGWGTGDHKSINERDKLIKLLSLPTNPIWLNQTHSNIALPATTENTNQPGDASFSSKPNQVCVVFTADCLPLLICNKAGTHVAAIHAGWRGLSNNIIENTIAKLNQPADQLLVWLGPAISPNHFEVGIDVYDAFVSADQLAAQAFTPQTKEKWLANLYQLATLRLHALGVRDIFGGDYCTYTQSDLFPSYRRDQGICGRIASLIWINKDDIEK